MFEINAEVVQYSVISRGGCTYWNNGKTLECLFANDYVADLFTVWGQRRNLYVNLERFRCISLPVSTPGVRAVLQTNYPSILVTDFEEIYKYQKQCI